MIKTLFIVLGSAIALFLAFVSGVYFSMLDDANAQTERQISSAKHSFQIAFMLRNNMEEEAFAHLEGDAFLALPHSHYLANAPSTPEYLRRKARSLEEALLTYFSKNPPPLKQVPNDFFDDQEGMTQENRFAMRHWLEQAEITQIEALKLLDAFQEQK